MQDTQKDRKNRKALVIGGAGFIGCNAAARLLQDGYQVVVFDNLSRKGTDENLAWLHQQGPIKFEKGDLRHYKQVEKVFARHADVELVLHLAAQVAVTTSVADPREDFETNALGTFNVLEAIRLIPGDPVLVYSSTNKVYGALEQLKVVEKETRYLFEDLPDGVSEACPLDFHTPYGCSKGAADQYVRDYARLFGLRTVVFRQSCIYGQRQFGVEDQGWVAWFVIATLLKRPITIYGNGKQVRDALHVDDLVQAYISAAEHAEKTCGQVYNIGGGPANTLAIWAEFGPKLEQLISRKIPVEYAQGRPGDQPVFICDISKAREDFGWEPKVSLERGIEQLYHWVKDNLGLIERILH